MFKIRYDLFQIYITKPFTTCSLLVLNLGLYIVDGIGVLDLIILPPSLI
jgi:hypothetical protein